MRRGAMMMAAVAAATLATQTRLGAETPTTWIHVRVDEPRHESKVSVNLPLSVVQAALALAPEKVISEGRIHIHGGHHDLSLTDLRRVWKELRATGEAEIVSVEDKDQTVRVTREGDRVRINVQGTRSKETVRVEVPVALVDALLSGEGQDLDLKGALAELQKLRGDLVHVDGEDGTVRIWVDERS